MDNIRAMNPATTCRAMGWNIGHRIVGDEGYGPTVIEITAIGEAYILAKAISRDGVLVSEGEHCWDLSRRDWQEVSPGISLVTTQGSGLGVGCADGEREFAGRGLPEVAHDAGW